MPSKPKPLCRLLLLALAGERDSLREQLSTAQQRIATASSAAVAEYAATASELLAQCGEEVTDLAAKADGHANDAATCRAAWPVMPVKASVVP